MVANCFTPLSNYMLGKRIIAFRGHLDLISWLTNDHKQYLTGTLYVTCNNIHEQAKVIYVLTNIFINTRWFEDIGLSPEFMIYSDLLLKKVGFAKITFDRGWWKYTTIYKALEVEQNSLYQAFTILPRIQVHAFVYVDEAKAPALKWIKFAIFRR